MVWLFGGSCRSQSRLDGKTVVVTGANTGIGKETAREFVARGARVILAVRDPAKGERAAGEIRRRLMDRQGRLGGGAGLRALGTVRVEELDLASLRSVHACARRLLDAETAIHVLVNNAGVMASPERYTEDGHDLQFGVNHLGHFLLTLLLLPRMRASAAGPRDPARVVTVSSSSYSFYRIDFDDLKCDKDYKPLLSYSRSKLANMLFSRELARRLKEAQIESVRTYCVHPGIVATELVRHWDGLVAPGTKLFIDYVGRFFVKTPKQGAQTSVHCAVDERAAAESGLYYADCSPTTPFAPGRDDEAAARLWSASLELVGLAGYDLLAASASAPPPTSELGTTATASMADTTLLQ